MTLSLHEAASASSHSRRTHGVPVVPARSAVRGLGVGAVTLDSDGFWGSRQVVNAEATIAHCIHWMERLGWIENFDRVASGEDMRDRAGWQFSDSEIYKLLEAMSWELARRPDAKLEASYTSLVARVAAAQDDDGYLSTAFGHAGLPPRYSDLSEGHELYNLGHLLQAAVARVRTHGADELVEVARRAADHVCNVFGADGNPGVCGHPEIEVALAEFGRALDEPRYLAQARLFVERRGHGTLPVRPLLSAEYFQDDVPVREATVLRGHAVRALYLSAGAADVAADSEDDGLLEALERQWTRTIERRTYLTGGMGSRHQDEGFGDDWELPADRAYCETCAGVASIMLAWRLYLATGEVKYSDLIERTLFNVVATSPREDGRAFFYANPLHQREQPTEAEEGVNHRAEGGVRAAWFDVSCCPTNVARTLASLSAIIAAVEEDADGAETLVLMQYAGGQVRAAGFTLRVETRYPDDGLIRITVEEAPETESTIRLRVPSWAQGATILDPDGPRRAAEPGWVDVRRGFAPGDVVELVLPLDSRFTFPDPRIDALRGTAAVERGPLVLCLESTDLPYDVSLEDVHLDAAHGAAGEADGARVRAVVAVPADAASGRPPYGPAAARQPVRTIDVTMIPYHRWAERGPSAMRVFTPTVDAMNISVEAAARRSPHAFSVAPR